MVIAASAGNHAQVFYRLNICHAALYGTTLKIKIDVVKSRGGEVVTERHVSKNEFYDYAMKLAESEKLTYIVA